MGCISKLILVFYRQNNTFIVVATKRKLKILKITKYV